MRVGIGGGDISHTACMHAWVCAREIISGQAWDVARFFRVVSGFMVRA